MAFWNGFLLRHTANAAACVAESRTENESQRPNRFRAEQICGGHRTESTSIPFLPPRS